MDSDLQSILSAILTGEHMQQADPHRAPPEHQTSCATPTIELNNTTYHLLKTTVDLRIAADTTTKSPTQAARLTLTLRPASSSHLEEAASSPNVEVAAHIFTSSSQPTTLIIDTDALLRTTTTTTTTPPQPPTILTTTTTPSSLEKTYHAYIASINARDMPHSLPTFCHRTVVHNDRPLPLAQYRSLMEDAQAAIPDIVFAVERLLVAAGGDFVAALLRFTGRPVGAFAGVDEAAAAAEGREVTFREIAFYWFVDGRIARVVSLVDLDGYRRQMAGESRRG